MQKFMLNNCTSSMLRGIARRQVHTIGRPAASLIEGETPVTVYEGPEYKDLAAPENYEQFKF